MNKKGDYKWGIILSLILGLMVLSLSLYFIFNELWSKDAVDREVCKQSIQVRSLLPNVEKAGVTVDSFKDKFPLKCKTKVVDIEESDIVVDKDGDMRGAKKKIAEAMAECWYLYDKGDANAFPAKIFKSSSCVPCARIHLTDDAKKKLGDNKIDIRGALYMKMDDKYSYYKFLQEAGHKFSAFSFGNGVPFNLEGDEFVVKSKEHAFYHNVELFVDGDELFVNELGITGEVHYPAKDALKLYLVDDDIRMISKEVNRVLINSNVVKNEGMIDSEFCKDLDYARECRVIWDYVAGESITGVSLIMKKKGDKGWVLAIDVAKDGDERDAIDYFCKDTKLINRLSGGTFDACMSTLDISLPKYFNPHDGDLLINYGVVTVSEKEFGEYIPYLFYFQTEQGRNPFNEVKKDFVFNFWRNPLKDLQAIWGMHKEGAAALKNRNVGMCEGWEGIPA